MTPEPTSTGSSQCETIGSPTIVLYSSAILMSDAFVTQLPSSEKATAPAAASSAISVSVSPALPLVIAAIG